MKQESVKGVKVQRHLTNERMHYVYYLPMEHYVGVTSQKDPKHRIFALRCKSRENMDIEGWRIIGVYGTREEARHHENLMHSWMGCNGVNLNN